MNQNIQIDYVYINDDTVYFTKNKVYTLILDDRYVGYFIDNNQEKYWVDVDFIQINFRRPFIISETTLKTKEDIINFLYPRVKYTRNELNYTIRDKTLFLMYIEVNYGEDLHRDLLNIGKILQIF